MSLLEPILSTTADAAPLVARLVLGLVILPHGLQKAFGWFGGYGPKATIGYFAALGIPAPLGWLGIAAETVGPLLLIAGLLSRPAALAVGGMMVVATALQHWPRLFMNWGAEGGRGEGFEYHLLALGLAAIVVLHGGGLWSLDAAFVGAR